MPKDTEEEEQEKKDEKFKGLCMNCENRYICILPKLPGGVWYCEEYQ